MAYVPSEKVVSSDTISILADKFNLLVDNAGASIVSDTEPTTGLVEGLVWFNTITHETKIYLGGEFRFAGGSAVVPAENNTIITGADTDTVSIGITTFDKDRDILFVFKNSTYLKRGSDYTISANSDNIVSTTGAWAGNGATEFDFLVLYSSPLTDVLHTVQLEQTYTATTDGETKIPINIPEFNKDTDLLEVFYDNMKLYKTDQWVFDTVDYKSIDLQGWSLLTGEKIKFYLWKKIRIAADKTDGTLLVENSVDNNKLATDIKVGSLLTLTTTDKSSVTNAINEVDSDVQALAQSLRIRNYMGV